MTYTTFSVQSDYSNATVENGKVLIAAEHTDEGIVLRVKNSSGTVSPAIDPQFNGIETALLNLSADE